MEFPILKKPGLAPWLNWLREPRHSLTSHSTSFFLYRMVPAFAKGLPAWSTDTCLSLIKCSRQVPLRHFLAIICLSCQLMGCTAYTHQRFLDAGRIHETSIDSGYFKHRLFRPAPPASDKNDNRLHIYIGGDGRPWRTPRQVASDPTSKRATMLRTMLRDESKSVYIGRPCYYQVTDHRCQGSWWTHDRYHPDVVRSLQSVVESLAENRQDLWLIGHSGGGTLAVLLGRRLDRPVKVLTINANLDLKAWTAHHQYTPLTGSLNPVRDKARNPQMQELHWYATEDQIILPEWVQAYCRKHQAHCLPVSGRHSTGWPEHWPKLLRCSAVFFAQVEPSAPNGRTRTVAPGSCLRE